MSFCPKLLIGCCLWVCLFPAAYAQGDSTTLYNEDVVVDVAVNGVALRQGHKVFDSE